MGVEMVSNDHCHGVGVPTMSFFSVQIQPSTYLHFVLDCYQVNTIALCLHTSIQKEHPIIET